MGRRPALVRLLVISAAAFAVSDCALFGIGIPDENSGDDAKRGGAAELATDTPVDDRVSAGDGDHTDWRVFELVQPTKVVIKIWWDDPDDVEGSLRLRGMAASQSRTVSHKEGARTEQIGPVRLPKGKWFVRVQATSGATVYTLEVQADGGSGGGGGGGLPEF